MALKTPPALVRAMPLLAAAALLASCGGGSTGEPAALTRATASAPPAPATTAAQPAPATTAASAPPAAHAHASRPRPAAAAAAPSSSPAAVADEPAQTTATTTAAAPAQPAGSPLDERADLVLTRRVSPSHYFQQGTVTGTYAGTMEIEARIASRGVLVRFTATLPGGTISGRGVAVAILDSTTWPALRGSAIVTGGTGRFAGIHGRRLRVSGRARPDASHARVRLTGTVY